MLFALHGNGFAFAMFGVMILLEYTGIGLLVFAATIWLLLWLPLAMDRVYGGPRWLTLLRWTVLAVLHSLSILAAIIAAFGMALAA